VVYGWAWPHNHFDHKVTNPSCTLRGAWAYISWTSACDCIASEKGKEEVEERERRTEHKTGTNKQQQQESYQL
jgi:hypothetical protein